MDYVLLKDLKIMSLDNIEVSLPKGTICKLEKDRFIMSPEGNCIAVRFSYNGIRYFFRNDDGKGMERGELIDAIVFKERKPHKDTFTRFNDEEVKILIEKWDKYLVKDIPAILFNHDFYEAEIDDLKQMAKDLNIIVKGEE